MADGRFHGRHPPARPPGRALFFDRSGAAISAERFLSLKAAASYRLVARDEAGPLVVITAWLGTDQGDGPCAEPPRIFGTIAYDPRTETFCEELETFTATEAEARRTHGALVHQLRH